MSGTKGTILVTGGSRGIGIAICRRLARDGWAVGINYAASREAAEALADAIRSDGGRAHAIACDIGDPAAIEPMFAAAEQALGPLAGLVNNAGILGEKARIDAQSADDLRRGLDVNVLGSVLCAGAAVRRLSTAHGGPGGVIVNLSSVAARTGGVPGLAAYAATKGAIESFTRGLATEVGREGIRVVALAPGVIETDMTDEAIRDAARRTAPMGRTGKPDEIADAVAWLMSDGAGYVTGTVLTVSGGR